MDWLHPLIDHVDSEDEGMSEILTPEGKQQVPHHQRIRSLQSHPFQQDAEGSSVQTLGIDEVLV